jgi:hypothetical protein
VKPEKQQLIHDLLGQNGCREATLLAGTRILRRRRRWRIVSQSLASLLALAAAAIWLEQRNISSPSTPPLARTTTPAAPLQPQALTDDQLLALFPHTPVGLATLSDGHKRLIFPRPGDEQKFITRL